MELITDHAGPRILGLPVVGWLEQREAARILDVTPRQVRNLHRKGLPSEGEGADRRYPLPHTIIWGVEWALAQDDKDLRGELLPFELAHARYHLRVVRAGGQMAWDPSEPGAN